MLEPGTPAPDFAATRPDGSTVRLSDLRGSKVAVYFYPKDDTPGCTAQACSIRDGEMQLQAQGIAVIGVSPDDAASHERFAEKYSLPFPLAADPDKAIATAYGVWGERSLYGRLFLGVKRTTFLLDENGTIVDVIKRPDTKNHADEVLRRFDKATA
ncbi:MAG: thioredoxin-dependent thiol peroxidase [Rhodothermales bacterium]|nr:thioredoxin-dependent thiol peroxidase [Rhodothermales bacterium]